MVALFFVVLGIWQLVLGSEKWSLRFRWYSLQECFMGIKVPVFWLRAHVSEKSHWIVSPNTQYPIPNTHYPLPTTHCQYSTQVK